MPPSAAPTASIVPHSEPEQRVRRPEVLGVDEVREGGARGRVEHGGERRDRREQDVDEPDRARRRARAGTPGTRTARASVAGDHQPPAVEPVREHARRRATSGRTEAPAPRSGRPPRRAEPVSVEREPEQGDQRGTSRRPSEMSEATYSLRKSRLRAEQGERGPQASQLLDRLARRHGFARLQGVAAEAEPGRRRPARGRSEGATVLERFTWFRQSAIRWQGDGPDDLHRSVGDDAGRREGRPHPHHARALRSSPAARRSSGCPRRRPSSSRPATSRGSCPATSPPSRPGQSHEVGGRQVRDGAGVQHRRGPAGHAPEGEQLGRAT